MKVDHAGIVAAVHAEFPPERTLEGALAFTLRVIQALPPGEGAGLLRKDAGENIIQYGSQMVSAARVCYPDGQLYKVATDVPTTLDPEWLDDGTVEPSRYVPVPVAPPPPPPAPPPPAPPPITDATIAALIGAIAQLTTAAGVLTNAVQQLKTTVDTANQHGFRVHL